jgi:ketosteroid isomerase-like protein
VPDAPEPPTSDADFEVVRRAWAAASQDDHEGLRAELHPEVVAVPFGAQLEGAAYRGPDAVIAWLRDEIGSSWQVFEVLPERFERVGSRMLVTGRWNARGLESGVELDFPATWLIEVRDGKVAYWQTFTEHEQGRRAAGLDD